MNTNKSRLNEVFEQHNTGAYLPDGIYNAEITSLKVTYGHTKGYYVVFWLLVNVDGEQMEVIKEHNIVSPQALQVLKNDLAPVGFELKELIDLVVSKDELIGMKVVVKKKTNGPHTNWYLVRREGIEEVKQPAPDRRMWDELCYSF